MVKATVKSAQIEDLILTVMGKHRPTVIRENRCMTCEGEATEFKNDISRKEYTISGMCQKCQDKVFK